MRDRKRLVAYLIPVIAGVTLIFLGFLSVSRIGKTKIVFEVSPSDSKIFLNNKSVGNPAYVSSGTYELVVSRGGFADFNSEIIVSDSSGPIVVVLEPNSEVGMDFLLENPEEQLLRESLDGVLENQKGEEILQKNPIISVLPFIDREFRIDYDLVSEGDEQQTIIITAVSKSAREDALSWIRFKGFDPKDYKIEYRSF